MKNFLTTIIITRNVDFRYLCGWRNCAEITAWQYSNTVIDYGTQWDFWTLMVPWVIVIAWKIFKKLFYENYIFMDDKHNANRRFGPIAVN